MYFPSMDDWKNYCKVVVVVVAIIVIKTPLNFIIHSKIILKILHMYIFQRPGG